MILALLISYVGFAFGFIASVAVARLLGVEGKGVFSLFQVTVSLILTFGSVGAGHGQMFYAIRTPDRLRHFMPNAYWIAFSLVGGIGVSYFALFDHVRAKLLTLGWPVLVAAVALVPVTSILVFQRQYFLARHEYGLSKVNLALSQALPVIAYGVLYFARRVSIANIIIGYSLSQVVCCLGCAVLTHTSAPKPESASWEFAKDSFSFGVLQYLSDLAQFLTTRLDFFIVAYFLGSAGLGIYSVAVSVAEVTTRLPRELGTILFPAFAAGHFEREKSMSLFRLTLVLGLFTAALLAVFCGPIILLLFGPSYASSIPAFRWLLPGIVAWATTNVSWSHTAANGRPGLGIPIFGAAAFVDAFLDFILVPKMGPVGAAIASTVAYAFTALLFAMAFCKQEGCRLRDVVTIRACDFHLLQHVLARTWTKARQIVAAAPQCGVMGILR